MLKEKGFCVIGKNRNYWRAGDGDTGLNTGGMGTFSPSPFYTKEVEEFCSEHIYQATVDAMAAEGREFKGVIFFGLMLTEEGPKVLEYNARFGDPEAQVVLPRMKNDLIEVVEACIDGTLDQVDLQFEDNAAVCVVLASEGYPVSYEKGFPIQGLEEFNKHEGYYCFHAGTKLQDGQIVESFPEDEKLIFGPDKNLGNYINSITGRQMLLWDGACHVHEKFSVEKIIELKKQYPDAQVLVHPECKGAVAKLADKIGSTAGLLKYAMASDKKDFIVATESGILYEMRKKCPEKNFIPAPPEDSTCACNECNFMRLNTLEKLYNTLKYEWPEVNVDEAIAQEAIKPIQKMLEISAKLGL